MLGGGALLLLACAAVMSQAAPAAKRSGAAAPSYNRDIRPILAENCFPCHGPDSAARKAGLRLDRFADAVLRRPDGGVPAIVPGDPVGSGLTRRILLPESDPLHMPPAAGHKSLTPAQTRTLLLWIEAGAKYEPHWSYIAPKRPALPAVKNAAWVRNPIDRFVLARLEREGLAPAPEADRRTLIRRVTLDLTGLPPEPAAVEAFVADKRPDAYERVVDRLLASPRWGEHRARYWLDAARYADTNGIHFDNYREMWSYRDWVIRAFNDNLPFDRFTVEQLAGDLLPAPSLEQRVATGFNRCNITTNEGGAIDEEYRVLYTRDRTETASQVWLGTTAGCAVCHDHKFDPLSQKEFYSLAAFFNNTTQAAMDGNVKDTPPVVAVPLDADRPRFDALQKEVAAARKDADARRMAARPDFDRWLTPDRAAGFASSVPADGLRFHAPLSEGTGRDIAATLDGHAVRLTAAADPVWANGQVSAKAFQRPANGAVEAPEAGDFEKDQAFTCAAWVKLGSAGAGGSVMARMDDQHDYRGWDLWLEGGRPGMHVIHKWPEDAVKVVSRDGLTAGRWQHVCVTYDGTSRKDGIKVYIDGAARMTDPQADALKSTVRTTVPLKIGQRHTSSGVDGTGVQDVRLYGRALPPAEVRALAQNTRAAYLAGRGASLAGPERDELFGLWLENNDAPYREAAARIAALQDEDRAIRARGTVAHVAQEKDEAAMAFVLFRGEYDRRREAVTPATPAALPPMPASFPKNRLGLARWLLLPENPLTTRVTVNRFWQEVFGQGLVRTAGDFGVTGELPSHPELLDWIAVEFRAPSEKGARPWDMKRLFRLMVTSAAYRQAATVTPDKRRLDPANRLLSRGPRFRMDAEMVRDYALASSGLLAGKIGGPSVKPYQPDGVWEAVAMIGSNTRDYKRDMGEALYRRSLYTFWKRSAPPASLEVFNAPSREVCTVRRERTDTPLQALVTLNDVQFVEAARHLAERALKQGGPTPAARADYVARRLLARPLRPEEKAVVLKSLATLEKHYRARPDDAKALITFGESKPDPAAAPAELAAWTMLTNQMMNLDEVLNK
jgi:cytochrome c553